MLHVDVPTSADLVALAEARDPASVSIYLPTTPVSGEVSGDRTVLRNLGREAIAQLQAAGRPKQDIAAIEAHIEDLADDDGFWRFQAHSLALFVTPTFVRTFRVPNALGAAAEVADRFFLKPLFRAANFPNSAYVLALALGGVRLLDVSADLPVSRVKVPGLPADATSALGVSSLGVRTESRRSDSAAGQRASLVQFCRMVDGALRGMLSGEAVPLFLAADESLGAIYRSVNSHRGLVPFGLDSSPDDRTDDELATATRPLLDRLYAQEIARVSALFSERAGSGRSTSDVAQAARAATMGAVDTLLVDIDGQVPGSIDEESGAVTFADTATAANYGVIDEIARRTLLSGGRVLAVRKQDLPAAPLAAILRWAV
jgi:hypothetical protein